MRDLEKITVLVDGESAKYSRFVAHNEVGLRIHLTPESKVVEIKS
jgi:hypothetical protein